MKKNLLIIFVVISMIVVTGCGKKKETSSKSNSDSNISSSETYTQEGTIDDGPSIIDDDTNEDTNDSSNTNNNSTSNKSSNSNTTTSNNVKTNTKYTTKNGVTVLGTSTSTVHFNTNGGNSIKDHVFCNSCAPIDYELPTPVKDGYYFAGWYADASFTKEVTGGRNTIKGANWTNLGNQKYETTIYAKWIQFTSATGIDNCVVKIGSGTATLHFNSNGGSSIADKIFCTACAPVQYDLPVPTRSGYTFDGWYADEKLTTKATGGKNTVNGVTWSKIDCNKSETTIYAKWIK